MSFTRLILFCSVLAAGLGVQAQETPGSGKAGAEAATAVAPTNSVPSFKTKATKIYAQNDLYATLIAISTGKEVIGLTVPARFSYKGSDNGREIVVYLDSSREAWVKFDFQAKALTEFTHEAVLPRIAEDLEEATPVFSNAFVNGQKSLAYAAKSGSVSNPKHIRIQVVQFQGGTLVVTSKAYGNRKDTAYYAMKELTSSLQFVKTERELKQSAPSKED